MVSNIFSQRLSRILAGLGLLGAVFVAAFILNPFVALAQQRVTSVGVDAVVSEPLSQTAPVLGRFVAGLSGVVSARVGGPVVKMQPQVGDRVAKGDVIAEIAAETFRWQRALSAAEVAGGKAAMATAKTRIAARLQELKRLEKLRKSASFSQARFEDKQNEVAQAKSGYAEAKAAHGKAVARLRLADIALADSKIRAPYSGVISVRHTVVGAYLNPGALVVTLVGDEDMEIEADVPARQARELTPGIKVAYYIEGRGDPLSATVRAVIPQENPLTRTLPVRFVPAMAGDELNLSANQSVSVAVPLGRKRQVVTVAKDAIINRKGMDWVFVVAEGKAIYRQVDLGQALGSRFEVLNGLDAGDVVVVRGNERLRPGMAVKALAPKTQVQKSPTGSAPETTQ